MSVSKYSNVLTIILVILIVAILGVGGYFVYAKIIKPYTDEKDIGKAIAQFDSNIGDKLVVEKTEEENNNEIELTNTVLENNNNTSSGGENKKTYYNGYVMLGHIEIPKTGISYPIIEDTTVKALETSVAVLYPTNAVLNSEGNTVIIGHNYRNGKFFSNNKKLSVGDKVYITGKDGKMEYIIYQVFETTTTDTSFYGRDTAGIPEITLSTCTDDGNSRLIILAKANV